MILPYYVLVAKTKRISKYVSSEFLLGVFVTSLVALVVLIVSLQTGFLNFSFSGTNTAFAGKAGLPGNDKNPSWYTTCTGADSSNPDQTPPTTTILSPQDNTYVTRRETITFKVEASDNVQLNRNELYINDLLQGIIYSWSSPYYHGWEVPPNAKPGTIYTVYSKTCDQANNYAITPTIKLIAR